MAEWKVFLDSGFWKHRGRDRAGTEIPVGKSFLWNGALWHVPAVYLCRAGLVVDYCIEIEPERICRFIEKVETLGESADQLSHEEKEFLASQNPLNVKFLSNAVVNGVQLCRKSGCSLSWIPNNCLPKGRENAPEWQGVMEHYQLDPEKGWAIHRCTYLWNFRRKPVVKSLQISLEQPLRAVTGMKFKSEKGREFTLTHPVTGAEYILTVGEIESQKLDMQRVLQEKYEYPINYTMMSYTLVPELPPGEFYICDCLQSDMPKPRQAGGTDGASAIGIIGRADGPTSIFLVGKSDKQPQVHSACSALHFEPVDEVEWKAVFRVKVCEDITVGLIETCIGVD
ncbi:MAG: sodium ion-translocating decarboxylase subunit beta [Lachnospiraceae bacterium]|nr:sodium ion-translocating decarboxylase subunit beta [Lachnospiraceae bacterium]